ncbi:MAG: 30S ribosomal protein S14 [Gemmatimonadaceae bacterium]
MAKTSKKVKNDLRKKLSTKHLARRNELRKVIKNPKTSDDDRAAAYASMRKLPRDSSPTRVRNRCQVSGRARGYEGFFGLSRIALREMALNGLLPGVRKSSW